MTTNDPFVIAIDGPAASGKSTVARRVAERLGVLFVNSGAMYRGFTWWVLENGVDPSDTAAVVALLGETEFACGEAGGVGTLSVAGTPMGDEQLSAEPVNRAVSAVATIPEVRERLVAEQRKYGERAGVVMEGRDIGTVVFPDAPYKFYIDASPEVRERRRRAQGIVDSIADRDRTDSSRATSPLAAADDAIVIDSSELAIDEVVGRVVERVKAYL